MWLGEFYESALFMNVDIEKVLERYPHATGKVNSFSVGQDIPNVGSIAATLSDYEALPGIRRVRIGDFGGPRSVFYAADDFERSRRLARKIRQSKLVDPLIIVVDDDGPYILEGAHRYVALHELGATHFPALVVVDLE